MIKFDRKGFGKYQKHGSIYSVFYGTKSYLIEDELNESQWSRIEQVASMLRLQLNSGFTNKLTIQTNNYDNFFSIENANGSKPISLLIDGYQLNVGANGFVDQPAGLDSADNKLIVKLNSVGNTNRTDLVILEAWFEVISGDEILRKFGGENTPELINNIIDNRVGKETSKRIQFRWRLRTIENKNSMARVTAFKYDGTDSGIEFEQQDNFYVADTGEVKLPSNGNLKSPGIVYAIPLFIISRDSTDEIDLSNIVDICPKATMLEGVLKDEVTDSSNIVEDENRRFVTDDLIAYWNNKASKDTANDTSDGLMSIADKIKLDKINVDVNNLLVTRNEKTNWNEKLDIAGGTMTGDLVLNNDPTVDLQAATKKYVDSNADTLSQKIDDEITAISQRVDNLSVNTLADDILAADADADFYPEGITSFAVSKGFSASSWEYSMGATSADPICLILTTKAISDSESVPYVTQSAFTVSGVEYRRMYKTSWSPWNQTITTTDVSESATAYKVARYTSAGKLAGTAYSADKLATGRKITLTGELTGETTFDGSANVSINASVKNADTVDGLHSADLLRWGSLMGAGDINSLIVPGIYHCQDTTLNRPENAWGSVTVSYISHNMWMQQKWIGQYGAVYTRHSIDSSSTRSWSRWRRVLQQGNVDNENGFFDFGTMAPSGSQRLNYSGNFYATRVYNAVYNDYAEYFEKGDKTLEPGDVVSLDQNSDLEVYVKSSGGFDPFVVGVYSDDYAQCIGGKGDGNDDENFCSVGLAGRVRVKVTGQVKRGDLLVASHIPGVAMAGHKVGCVIGKALESHEGEDIHRIKAIIMNS